MDSQDRAQVTPEMFYNWLQYPVTQRFREALEEVREQLVNQLTDYNRPCSVEEMAKLKGCINGIDMVLSWKVE